MNSLGAGAAIGVAVGAGVDVALQANSSDEEQGGKDDG